MTQPTLDDALLHRYYDGDLSPEEAAKVEAALADDEGAQEKLGALEELGALVRAHSTAAGADLDADALFASIEAGLQHDEDTTEAPPLRVIAGGASPRPQSRAPAYIMIAVAAAALLVFFIGPTFAPEPIAENDTDVVTPEREEEPGLVIIDTAPAGSEVLAVDFGSNTGTAFTVEGDVGQPVAVLWISDEETTIQ